MQAMTRNISEEDKERTQRDDMWEDEIPAEAWKCVGNFGTRLSTEASS